MGDIKWDDINSEKSYSAIKAYGQSKLANILFTIELNHLLKGTGVTAYALHPGSVNTGFLNVKILKIFLKLLKSLKIIEVLRYTGKGLSIFVPFLMILVYPFWLVIAKTPKEGAQTTIYCAVADEALEYSGHYFK